MMHVWWCLDHVWWCLKLVLWWADIFSEVCNRCADAAVADKMQIGVKPILIEKAGHLSFAELCNV